MTDRDTPKAKEQRFDVIKDMGTYMNPNGIILETIRYVLQPLVHRFEKGNQLHELFFFELEESVGHNCALAYLWFGLSIHKEGSVKNDNLLPLFTSDTHLKITNGDVMYRKLLAEIAGSLASDSDEAKKFINRVVITHEAYFKKKGGKDKYTPPVHERENHNAYFHYLLTLFIDADDMCIIEPTDLAPLEKWLTEKPRLVKKVSKFNPDETFTKHFTASMSIPNKIEDPNLERQCSDIGSGEAAKLVIGSNSKVVGEEIIQEEQSDELESYKVNDDASHKREIFKEAKKESSGSTEKRNELESCKVNDGAPHKRENFKEAKKESSGSTDEVGQKKSSTYMYCHT